jgi:multidrug transporter EmrE-like cation transporter
MPSAIELTILFTAIAMGAFGQLAMKAGMNRVRERSGGELGPIIKALPRIFSNLYVLVGVGIYVLSTVLWIKVLSTVPLSFAYPCISVSYVIIIVAGRWVFRERIDVWKIAAIALIIAGVIALGFSERPKNENNAPEPPAEIAMMHISGGPE